MNLTKLQTCKQRGIRLVFGIVLLFALGGGYVWFARNVFGIPCLFYQFTGLKCPGCGVTRMVLCLLSGDWRGAFDQNGAVLCLLPAAAVLFCSRCVGYFRTGTHALQSWETVLVWCMVGILLFYGIGRNVVDIFESWDLTI